VFILSTGRTGTQFFEEYITATSGEAFCLHEPPPSRRFKFYSNMYLAGRISDKKIVGQFLKCRKNILRRFPGMRYIESSNFMFGCIPSLNTHFEDIGVIHITRHPESYVKSHLGHGFWNGHKKFFAKHVPYWLEKLEVEDRNNPVELLAARWVMVNRKVASYADTNPYLRIQFEELFSSPGSVDTANGASGVAEINRIRAFCGIEEADPEETLKWIGKPKNISSRKTRLSDADRETISQVTAEAASEFGYSF